jgi:NAD-dependent DNA ligase
VDGEKAGSGAETAAAAFDFAHAAHCSGSKLKKAQEIGVTLVDEEAFSRQLLRNRDNGH